MTATAQAIIAMLAIGGVAFAYAGTGSVAVNGDRKGWYLVALGVSLIICSTVIYDAHQVTT